MRPSIAHRPQPICILLLCAVCSHLLHAQSPASDAQRATLVRSSSGQALDAQGSHIRNPSPTPAMPAGAWTTTSPNAPRAHSMVVPASGLSDGQFASSSSGNNALTATASHTLPPAAGALPAAAAKRTPLNPTPADGAGAEDAGGARSTVQMLVSMGSSLLIVLGLFMGVAWFFRKTVNTSLGGGIPKQVVDVLGRTPIAARQQLVLVRFGSKLVLVSIVQGDARAISEIDEPLEVDRLAGLCESSKPGSISQSFRSVLTQGGTA